jgi:SNF2 family DNA or RNA helicase
LAARSLVNSKTLVIVDESSFIKGHRSWRTLRITDIGKKAGHKLILTGTPMSQGVEDLFAQFRFLDSGILGYTSWYTFARNHLEYSDKYPGLIVRAHNTAHLADKIAPWTYQVTKDECLDLPPKISKSVYYQMSWEQRQAYNQAKWEILMSAPDDEVDSYVIFQLFTALQQITSGYWNRSGQIIELPNPRFKTLIEFLEQVQDQTIIWCKYLRSLHQIAEKLESPALLYGGLNEKERSAEIERFKNGDTRFLVATTSTGGHGLNLTEATVSIFYESSFKYAERLQAEDRNHRIGQDNKVLYVDLICSGSIDDRIAQALAKKKNVVEDFKAKVDKAKEDPDAMRKLLEEL